MNRAQQYINSILEKFPAAQLPTEDDRSKFEQIRLKFANALDLQTELRSLYRVRGFDAAALSLLWIAERVELDPSKLESTQEEEALVEGQFKEAFGMSIEPATALGSETVESPFEALQSEQQSVTERAEPPPVEFPVSIEGTASTGAEATSASSVESEFSMLVEKFVEAMQGGDDTRDGLMEQVLQQCGQFSGGETPEMLQKYCGHMTEFLNYVRENQFMDDVRVMNILSNITSPLSQWVAASPDQRAGLLDEGVATLMDFKSLFE